MQIIFHGRVCGGAGKFREENVIPSPVEGLRDVPGWPSDLVGGTFNILVDKAGWPEVPGLDFRNAGVQCMDRAEDFPPALYLPHSYIPNNTLTPQKKGAYCGDLQFWRASLSIENEDEQLRCYMLRRVKSGYKTKLEIVAPIQIRTEYELENNRPVELIVYDGVS